MRRRLAVALLLAAGCGSAAAKDLSDEERRIVRYIDAHHAEAVALLERAVRISSPTQDVAGVRSAGRLFQRELEALGMSVRWVEMPRAMQRAGHLVAQTPGHTGKRILLLGHLDTVLPAWTPRREGRRLYGSGAADMKSGDVILLHALKALRAVGALHDARITVMLTGDEENPGTPVETARAEMLALAQRSDVALGFEETVRNTATIGRRGVTKWRLDVRAATGHSSGIFGKDAGSGAAYEIARILHAFHEAFQNRKYLTLNPSVVVAGTEADLPSEMRGRAAGKSNVIAGHAHASGDLRFIDADQERAARDRMRRIAADSPPHASARIRFDDVYPAMAPTRANRALLEQLDAVSQALDLGEVEALDPGERGAGDISFIADLLPCLDGIGSRGGDAHTPDEYVDLDSLAPLTKRAALLIYRLTR